MTSKEDIDMKNSPTSVLMVMALIIALMGVLVLPHLGDTDLASAKMAATATVLPVDKNSPQPEQAGSAPGSFSDLAPEPGSKNYDNRAATGAPAGTGQLNPPPVGSKNYTGKLDVITPEPSSKNFDNGTENGGAAGVGFTIPAHGGSKNDQGSTPSEGLPKLAEALTTAGSLITCGASGENNWTTTSGSFAVIRQCNLTAPQAGWVFISTNGSIGYSDGEYEARFEIGIDSTSGDTDIDRWVNIYYDAIDGDDESVALSVLKPIATGTHTIYFLGSRYNGSGEVLVFDPTLTAIYVPFASATALACGASGDTNWTTASSSLAVIRQCSLTVPGSGWVLISTDGSVARSNGEYEARFEMGIDSTSGDPDIDRWVNVYDDAGDGTDRSVALSVLKNVVVGTHNFYFLGSRSTGSGQVLVYDPTLTVIYVPFTSVIAMGCGASGNMDWTTTSSSLAVIRQCDMTVPQAGYVFISTDGSLALSDSAYGAQFDIGIDSTTGDPNIDRWVDVYTDTGDGTDKSVALSVLKPVTAGMHTIYFLGKRYNGSGTALVYDPTLTIIYIPPPSPTAMACGASGNMNWTTTSGSMAVIRQCSLKAPQDGWVFISANGSLALQDSEYEARFEIGIDSTSGDPNIDRWVDVYDDTGDGTDESVALSVLKPIAAGTHTIYFLGSRSNGSGTVQVFDPTLTAIYVPNATTTALACGASGNLGLSTTSSSFEVIRQCSLAVPQDGWVFISADSSLGRADSPYEAQFEIGIDNTSGEMDTDRWVNIYDDAGNGTDKSVALSGVKPITAGTHTL